MMDLYGIDTEAVRRLDTLLESGKTVTVTAHTHPDGDALGSVSACVGYLRECRGKDAVAVLPDSPAATVRPIVPAGVPLLCFDTEPEACLARIAASDLVILLDGNGFSRTEGLQDAFEASPAPKVLIDHHVGPEADRFRLVFSTPDVSSASELLYYILLALPDIGQDPRKLPADAARALLTGMTTDTNNFANSVYPGTFRMAADLIAAGVDREAVLADLYNRYRENRVRVMGYLQYENMHITPEGLAYIIATRDILDRFGVEDGETEGLVNVPLSIDRVKMSILLKEDEGHFRVSIRSKKGWSARDCARDHFNGGGHENASGGKLWWPRDIAGPRDAAAYLEKVSRECLS
jgi:phosphoesterase RecJ-like protein